MRRKYGFTTVTKEQVFRETGISEQEFKRLQKKMSAKIVQAKATTGYNLYSISVNRLILEYTGARPESTTGQFVLSLGSSPSKKNVQKASAYLRDHFHSLIIKSKLFSDIIEFHDDIQSQIADGKGNVVVKKIPRAVKIANVFASSSEDLNGFTTTEAVNKWNELLTEYENANKTVVSFYNNQQHTARVKTVTLEQINKLLLEYFRKFVDMYRELEDQLIGSP